MNQAAVQASVSVGKRMDIYKPERHAGGMENGVDARVAQTVAAFVKRGHEICNVTVACADKLGQGLIVTVATAQKHLFGSVSRGFEPVVADQDAVEAINFRLAKGSLPASITARPHRSSRLTGGRSPSISKLARLSSSSTKLAARAMSCASAFPIVSRVFAERSRAIIFSSFRSSPYDGTQTPGTQKVVADAVSR